MSRNIVRITGALVLLALLLTPLAVFAHETITAGDYAIEYGWANEPPVAGQRNVIVINIGSKSDEGIEADVSGLTVELEYGGQTKTLELSPLADGQPGQFIAPVTPTRAGQYTLKFSGKLTGALGDVDVNASVEPDEVAASDPNVFPSAAAEAQSSGGLNLEGWLGVGGLVAGLLGLGLGIVALTRKK